MLTIYIITPIIIIINLMIWRSFKRSRL